MNQHKTHRSLSAPPRAPESSACTLCPQLAPCAPALLYTIELGVRYLKSSPTPPHGDEGLARLFRYVAVLARLHTCPLVSAACILCLIRRTCRVVAPAAEQADPLCRRWLPQQYWD